MPEVESGQNRAWLRLLPEAAPLLVLWLVVLAFFWPYIAPYAGRACIAPGDFTHQAFPFHSFTAQELAAGRLPLWSPHIYAGHPFQADPQTAVFYPLGLLVALVAGRSGLPMLALEWQVIINFLLAATFVYLLVHHLTGSRWSGLAGSLAFTLSGYLTSYPMQQLPILETVIWLPLALYCIERAWASGRWLAWMAGAGLSMGVSLLAGHPQTWMLAAYTCLAYILWHSLQQARCRGWRLVWSPEQWLKLPAGVSLLLALSGGVAAVQLLPTLEFIPLTIRQPLLFHEAGHGYDYASLVNLALPLWRVERGPYIGVLALLLAGLAMLRSDEFSRWGEAIARIARTTEAVTTRSITKSAGQGTHPGDGIVTTETQKHRSSPLLFWAVLGITALVMSLGDRTPLFHILFYWVPGFSLFKDQERTIFLFALSGSVLAGYGMRGLLVGWGLPLRAVLALTGVILAGAATFVWGVKAVGQGSADARNLFAAYAFFFPLALAGVALLWWRPGPLYRPVRGALVLALLALDLFVVNQANNQDICLPLVPAATAEAVAALPTAGQPYRVRAGDQRVLAPNDSMLLDIQNPAGDSPMGTRWVLHLLASEYEWRIWQLFNVQHILTYSDLGQGTERVARYGELNTYRMAYALPRAWMVRDVQIQPEDNAAKDIVLARPFNPARTVVLDRVPNLLLVGLEPPQDQKVHFLEYSPQRLELRVSTTDDAMLVLSETYHPGWRATLDGATVPIYRANLAFRAVEIPAGEHHLIMSYEPVSFRLGVAITLASLVMAAGLVTWSTRRVYPMDPR